MADEENKEEPVEGPDESEGRDNDSESNKTLDQEEMFVGELKHRSIVTEMEESYLDYAMSVIVSRALPDVRDGLKPVHRRILYAMHDIGLRSSAGFRKSASVVGEVLAKYHPHGDTAVYDSMVRMAQDFSLRYMLVRGQGNFGSIDGDSAAAMRYTEAKMHKIADEILADIDKGTVDWKENYDGRYKEPTVMPTRIPQLLLNGTMGIAVGMATNIPPHNLNEILDAVIHVADNPEADFDDLMEIVKGPDFPTGGIIYDKEAIKQMYVTGRGGIKVRAQAEIVEMKNGKSAIIVNEIPYGLNKSSLVSKMADLVRDKKVQGITDLRDESNREGIRIVIELKRDSFPKKVLNQLFKYTSMQTSFNMNMIALVDGIQPRLLNLKQVLEYFIAHRKEVITRRTQYDLDVAEARAHILEGLKIALDDIDKVIATIRAASTKEEAKIQLMKKFKLSDIQAQAILEMRLQTLAGLERKKIEDEYKEKMKLIAELKGILADTGKVLQIMKDELAEIKEKYGDERRTVVVDHAIGQISAKDTVPNEPMILMLTEENYIKRMPPSSFRSQGRGGKGMIGAKTKDEDQIKIVRHVMNHDDVLYFTSLGRVFRLPAYEIPKASRQAKGQAVVNILQLQKEERVTAIHVFKEGTTAKYVFMATRNGTVKKTPIEDFSNVRKSGLIAIKIREGDSLEWVKGTAEGEHVFMVTHNGKSIQFNEANVRSMGRASIGVRGIKLKEKDYVVEMDVLKEEVPSHLLIVTEKGLGKMTNVKEYRYQTRGGTGVKTANLSDKTGFIIGAKVLEEGTKGDMILVSKNGQIIRMPLDSVPSRGRATQGVYLMRMKGADRVASISIIKEMAIVEEPAKKDGEKNPKAGKKAKAKTDAKGKAKATAGKEDADDKSKEQTTLV